MSERVNPLNKLYIMRSGCRPIEFEHTTRLRLKKKNIEWIHYINIWMPKNRGFIMNTLYICLDDYISAKFDFNHVSVFHSILTMHLCFIRSALGSVRQDKISYILFFTIILYNKHFSWIKFSESTLLKFITTRHNTRGYKRFETTYPFTSQVFPKCL